MTDHVEVRQQVHGYQGGHGLLRGNIKLSREDQDLVDRLSDIAGPLRPSEKFDPYLTAYPLPSEQFYVVARTWQDSDAPRAGCVLTRSLFIPMDIWERSPWISELARSISRPHRENLEQQTFRAVAPNHVGPIQDLRLPEIVEALFLETRRPIVVFDSPDAEAIALRVVTALWPSRRRNFATCSWCLSPRKLRGRDFDLVFAPRDARTRFADWSGRRIDAKDRPAEARHRWTTGLVETVFGDGPPNLGLWDELGILDGDQVGDEGALRLSLMWRELEAKARSTPNAVLGMLDILNSNNVKPATAQEYLEPLVANAVSLAREAQAPEATWRFYINLLGKFSDRLPSRKTLRELRDASTHLAADAPESAVAALHDLENSGRELPAVLAAGIGDGLSIGAKAAGNELPVAEIGRHGLLRLLAYSKRFSTGLAENISSGHASWADTVIDALEAPDQDLIKRARRNLLPALTSAVHAPLLPPLLGDVKPNEIPGLVRTIGKATDFEFEEFDGPLINAARSPAAVLKLREAVLDASPSPGADRLLGHALRFEPQDVSWVLSNVAPSRGAPILAEMIDGADEGAVQMIWRDTPLTLSAIDWLLDEPGQHARRIARLLRSGEVPVGAFVETGLQIYSYLQGVEKSRFGLELLKRALAELPSDATGNTGRVLDEVTGQVESGDLVLLLTQQHASQERIRANLVALASAPEDVRRKAASRVDQLTSRLITRGTHTFDEAAYIQWADLIQSSRSISNQSHLHASIEVLSYALRQTRWPLSALIVVSFPTVYRQLLASKGESDFEFHTLLLLPLAIFADWDRAKSARRELVDAFMESNWPPANLLLAALEVGIDQKVLRRVSRNRGGQSYIEKVWTDADRLQDRLKLLVRDAVGSTLR